MVRIPVFNYICRAPGKAIHVPTFKSTEANKGRLMGEILAPDGSSLRQSAAVAEPPKLKVPKPGRESEFWLLAVAEAIAAARSERYGLEWESAHAEATVR